MKLSDIFHINQGHQITDEELYHADGRIPVITGKNNIKGYWGNAIVRIEDLPCITYPTKGNAGNAYLQNELFDANNTAVLSPKKEWRGKIDLEWFIFKLRPIFLNLQTSKEGVSYLNKEIVENVEVDIPSRGTQEKEKMLLKMLYEKKEDATAILEKIKKIKGSNLVMDYKEYQIRECPVKEIFDVLGGNSGLTEEYIYSQMDKTHTMEYQFLTGSFDSLNDRNMIPRLKNPSNPNDFIRTHHDEGIQVIRKGKAGHINYLPKGKYTLNDDTYLLFKKEKIKWRVNLKWVYFTQKEVFHQFASNADNGTWNKTGFFKYGKIDLPIMEEQNEWVDKLNALNKTEQRLKTIEFRIEEILEKDLS